MVIPVVSNCMVTNNSLYHTGGQLCDRDYVPLLCLHCTVDFNSPDISHSSMLDNRIMQPVINLPLRKANEMLIQLLSTAFVFKD